MSGGRLRRGVAVLIDVAWLILSVAVEMESRYVLEHLGGRGPARALILYHPAAMRALPMRCLRRWHRD